MKPSALVISFSALDKDPRVTRQIQFLSKKYRVTAIGYSPAHVNDVTYIQIKNNPKPLRRKIADAFRLYSGDFENYYWGLERVQDSLEKAIVLQPDLVVANDLDSLPLAFALSKGAQVICDAHEYAPKEFEENVFWRLFLQKFKIYLCKTYLPKADRVLTVCDGIAEEFQKEFGVRCSVITNAPYASHIKIKKCEERRVRMIFHGLVDPSRKIEKMIEMMNFVDPRFELDLILMPGSSSRYLEKIKKMATQHPKIKLLPPVPMQQIVPFCSQYDIGLYLIEPSNFNNQHCLPNKFFEFIQAKLAIAIGPSVEMAKIVNHYHCGIVSKDFSSQSLANSLNQLSVETINQMKHNCQTAANSICAERNEEIFHQLLEPIQRPREIK